jgi:arylsulfatase A-like enzyme/Tfp pilus assembly protein PilF
MRPLGFALATFALLSPPAWAAIGCGSRPGKVKPNVVLITIDTLRADHVGAYGDREIQTPGLDALAHDGVLFENAIVQVPLTFPSHAAILTGTQPFTNGVHDFTSPPLDIRHQTLAQMFKACGYATGAVVSSFVLERSWGLARGFDSYDDRFEAGQFATRNVALVERPAGESVGRAIAWLGRRRTVPFFLWLHLYDPHSPYHPPEPYATRYKDRPYDGEIAYADSQVQRLIAYLKQHSLYDSTAVLVTSDHGESLGEHGEREHGFFIYRATTRVPLILKPQRSAGAKPHRVAETVQSVDIAPTLLQLAGIQADPKQFDGAAIPLTSEPEERLAYNESYYSLTSFGWSPLRGLQNSSYQFIQAPRGELYDLTQDPGEKHNIAATHTALTESSASKLQGDATAMPSSNAGEARSPEALAKLQALGYLAFGAPVSKEKLAAGLADPKDKVGELNSILAAQDAAQLGNFQRSEELLAEVEHKDPDLYLLPFLRGEGKMRQSQWNDAAGLFEKALQLNPGFEQALTGLASAYQRGGREPEARKTLEVALKERPSSFRIWYQLGTLLARESPAEAESAFQRGIALQPGFGYSYRDLGLLQESQKKYAEAAASLQKAADLGVREASMFNHLGICYRQLAKLPAAIGAYRQAIKMDPGLAEAHLNLGLALEESGQAQQAHQEYQRACEMKQALCRLAKR